MTTYEKILAQGWAKGFAEGIIIGKIQFLEQLLGGAGKCR